ncbi:MAG: hypothetical protein WCX97_00100 [Candidatus Magasanikbacteria bacterium]
MSKFIKFSFLAIPVALIFLGAGCGDAPSDQSVNYENDVKPLIETTEKAKVRGSCNVIDSKSTCIDFVGSIFTEERMKSSCVEGKFSLDACPYSDLGGCQATPGTVSESIVWSYDYGGEPISAEEVGYQAKACNALGMAKWVLPSDLLNK